MVKCRSTLEWMLPYRNFSAQWSLVVTLKRRSKPEAKRKLSDILTETHDGVFYQGFWRKPPWILFLFELWHIHKKHLKGLLITEVFHFLRKEKSNIKIITQGLGTYAPNPELFNDPKAGKRAGLVRDSLCPERPPNILFNLRNYFSV